MTPMDLRCYFVTGRPVDASSPAKAHAAIVTAAARAAAGGAGMVQVRSKPISARDLYELGKDVADAVHSENPATQVLIDDRVDVALALKPHGVAGVHVGQDDLDVRVVRELLGPDAIIGLTTGTRQLVEHANEVADVIDYIGCGPFRATPTKESGRPLIGLSGYPELVALSEVPLVAIGDVTAADAAALAETGVAGLAIVRGIMHAADPAAYCRRVVSEFARGHKAASHDKE